MLCGADVIVRGFTRMGTMVREFTAVVVADTPHELWTKIADHAAAYHQSRTDAVRIVVDVAVDVEPNRRALRRVA